MTSQQVVDDVISSEDVVEEEVVFSSPAFSSPIQSQSESEGGGFREHSRSMRKVCE